MSFFDRLSAVPYHISTAVCLSLFCLSCLADSDENKVKIEDLGWLDKKHLQQQVQKIDDIGREKLGTPVRGNTTDLVLLQRIINRGLVDKTDRLTLQALGAVLGNVMVQEFGLEWKDYTDALGTSRAACVPNTQECLFPITMLSRRMEVGLLPNVQTIYDNSYEMIQPLLPKLPYQVD